MSLLPMEKIAADQLDRRTLMKIGALGGIFYHPLLGLAARGVKGLGRLGLGGTRLAGKAAWGGAELLARGAQATGEAIANHPRAALAAGVPAAFGLSTLSEKMDRYQNNVNPENPYRY